MPGGRSTARARPWSGIANKTFTTGTGQQSANSPGGATNTELSNYTLTSDSVLTGVYTTAGGFTLNLAYNLVGSFSYEKDLLRLETYGHGGGSGRSTLVADTLGTFALSATGSYAGSGGYNFNSVAYDGGSAGTMTLYYNGVRSGQTFGHTFTLEAKNQVHGLGCYSNGSYSFVSFASSGWSNATATRDVNGVTNHSAIRLSGWTTGSLYTGTRYLYVHAEASGKQTVDTCVYTTVTLKGPELGGPVPEHTLVSIQAQTARLAESNMLSPQAMGRRQWPKPAGGNILYYNVFGPDIGMMVNWVKSPPQGTGLPPIMRQVQQWQQLALRDPAGQPLFLSRPVSRDSVFGGVIIPLYMEVSGAYTKVWKQAVCSATTIFPL